MYICGMEMNLSKYSIEELVELKNIEKDLTRMFDSDVKVALALLDEIRKIK